mmetsp:Transcript_98136/g.233581  ORF Transcript_98136/g.233581 Transcript_98136/m.233581 type:complete len:200 (-) Transcript_98136:1969-2568(-)
MKAEQDLAQPKSTVSSMLRTIATASGAAPSPSPASAWAAALRTFTSESFKASTSSCRQPQAGGPSCPRASAQACRMHADSFIIRWDAKRFACILAMCAAACLLKAPSEPSASTAHLLTGTSESSSNRSTSIGTEGTPAAPILPMAVAALRLTWTSGASSRARISETCWAAATPKLPRVSITDRYTRTSCSCRRRAKSEM